MPVVRRELAVIEEQRKLEQKAKDAAREAAVEEAQSRAESLVFDFSFG